MSLVKIQVTRKFTSCYKLKFCTDYCENKYYFLELCIKWDFFPAIKGDNSYDNV